MKIIQMNILDNPGTTLTGYIQEPSKELATMSFRPAVLVLPGGAYLFTSDREAEPIALTYAAEGFQTFVLRYSVGRRAAGCKPLREAEEALRIIRENAGAWHVKADQIAVCGFSAGGHLAAWVGLQGAEKPNAIVLGYPAVQLFSQEDTGDSAILKALLGDDYTRQDAERLNLDQHVDDNAVPMFCWGTAEDMLDVSALLRLGAAYGAHNKQFELHVFQEGEHGLSLAVPHTANGRLSMVDAQAAHWVPLSISWLWRRFGAPEVVDKPYEPIPGLIPQD